MSDKGYTKKETDFWGNVKEVHYDSRGNKTGETIETTTVWGSPIQEHYNAQGNKVGTSQLSRGVGGDERVEHYSNTEYLGYTKPGRSVGGEERLEHFSKADYLGHSVPESDSKIHHYGSGGISFKGTHRTNESLRHSSSSGAIREGEYGILNTSDSRSSSIKDSGESVYGNGDYGGGYEGSVARDEDMAEALGILLVIGLIILALVFGAKSCLTEIFSSHSSPARSVSSNYQRYNRSSATAVSKKVSRSAVKSISQNLSSPVVKQPTLSYWNSINQMKSVIDKKPIQSYSVPKITAVSAESVSAGTETRVSPPKIDLMASIEKMKADLEAQSIEMAKIRDEIKADVASIHGGD